MSVTRRKDNKGRVLKDGESQRTNGTYMYRYTDRDGKRRSIYANDLKALRDKEEKIEKETVNEFSLEATNLTVLDLMQNYTTVKQDRAEGTKRVYKNVIVTLMKSGFANMPIITVTKLAAQQYILWLFNEGKAYGTIKGYYGIIKSCFGVACENDIISKNPFNFSLSTILRNTTIKKEALTPEQTKTLLSFAHSNKVYRKYENDIRILLGTGLRIGELYGLTMKDLDFNARTISVTHQIRYDAWKSGDEKWSVTMPKSKSGIRTIPMTDDVFYCLQNVIENRPQLQNPPSIDGYSDFVFIYDGGVRTHVHLEQGLRNLVNAYNRQTNAEPLPHVTPHTLRHTFCSNIINAGINVKSAQYLMGHSNVKLTLDVYSHANKTTVFSDFYKATQSCI